MLMYMLQKHHVMLLAMLGFIAVGSTLAIIPSLLPYAFGLSQTYTLTLKVVAIAVFGLLSVRFLSLSILSYGMNKKRMDEKSIAKVVTLLGYIVVFLMILSALHVNFTGILIGAGFLSVVIGLASQSTIGNLFAGISMMVAKPFANGDRITFSTWQYGLLPPSYTHSSLLPGYSGTIVEVGLMYTKVKLDDGPSIFVPNGIINQAVIINYTLSDIKGVTIRVELTKRNFDSFQKEVESRVRMHKKLSSIVKGNLDIMINDIGIVNYGVNITATVPIEKERYVQSELSKIALATASRFQKR